MRGELVYVVGPLGAAEQAVRWAQCLIEEGHLAVFKLSEVWSALDAERLAGCGCVLRLPGESRAADLAVDRAKQLGMPVHVTIEACLTALREHVPAGTEVC